MRQRTKSWLTNILLSAVLAGGVSFYLVKRELEEVEFDLVVYVASTIILICIVLSRRPPVADDRRWWVVLICGFSFCYPFAYDVVETNDSSVDRLIWSVRVGIHLFVDLGLIMLGRSFAILPALRVVRTQFLYRIVRHPVYSMYILADIGFLFLQPSLWNACVAVAGAFAFVTRAKLEETVLSRDPAYREYALKVRWKFVPGVY